MSRLLRLTLVAAIPALAGVLNASPAAAQSDILLRLRSGSPLGDRARVDSAGGFVAMGELGIGIIPATGPGYRMMWYPFKAAFRAGGTDDGGAGNYWDDANVGFYSWAGGNLTMASAYATFAFGDQTTVSGVGATGFGSSTTVTGSYAFSAGALNDCLDSYCVAIGYDNTANGDAAVALGYKSTADANYSVAIGYRASTNGRTGSFVISDQSTTDSTEASANNQFMSRFANGYRLYTNSGETLGAFMGANATTWSAISDRNRKELFLPVDGEDVLARIRSMPVTTWRFIGDDTGVRHIGPMAQDWHRAFGFTADSTIINSGDFDGVNLAAAKALEERTAAQQAEIAGLRLEVQALRAANAALEARLLRLEARNPP